MEKVFVVTVLYTGDYTTSPWAVFADLKDAEAYKNKLEEETKDEENYLVATISEHDVK